MAWINALRVAARMGRPGRHRFRGGRIGHRIIPDSASVDHSKFPSPAIAPPKARRLRGPDPYAWLEQQNDEVLEHLKAENRYTCEAMRPTLSLQQVLYKEMAIKVDQHQAEMIPPERINGFWHYCRREDHMNWTVHYRSRQPPQLQPMGWQAVDETVVLDPVRNMKLSPDNRLLAFTLAPHDSSAGVGSVYVRDLEDKEGYWWTSDAWSRVVGFEWGGTHVLYTTHDDHLGRPCEVRRTDLDTDRRRPAKPPQRIWEEKDDQFFVNLRRTKDGRFVTIHATSKISSEVWLLDCSDQDSQPVRVCPRRPHVQYFVDHAQGHFYIITNARHGVEHELCRLPSASFSAAAGGEEETMAWEGWEGAEWICPTALQEGAVLEDMDVFQDFLVVYDRVHARPGMRVLDLRKGESMSEAGAWHHVALPPEAEGAKVVPGLNQDYAASTVRFCLTSPILPRVTYDYDMGRRTLIKLEHEALDDGKGGRYVCHHVLTPATPEHPTSVPLTLVHQEGLVLDGSHPVLLLGYGAYGISICTGFRMENLPLLRRGWVLAFAHPRGGGELGRAWHHAGRGKSKANSMVDYLRCAEWLVERGYTSKGRVAAWGGSAGGLLVGGAANRRPELFGAMVLHVPFLDIIRTMRDPSLPLTIHEYDEWGDPGSDAGVLKAMQAYSPYETLPAGCKRYPNTLVLASLADDRVHYWEAAKWVARARHRCPSSLFLLRVEASRGHAGFLSEAESLHETAFVWAFLISTLGPAKASDERPPRRLDSHTELTKDAFEFRFARVPNLAWPIVAVQ